MDASHWAVFLIGGAWGAGAISTLQHYGPWVAIPLVTAGLMMALPPIWRSKR